MSKQNNETPSESSKSGDIVMHKTEVCPECGMNHRRDVFYKNQQQDKIRTLRRALRMAVGEDEQKYQHYLTKAEDQMPEA